MLASEATELRDDEARRRGAKSAMPDQNDDRSGTGSDEVLKALDELESVLRENAESERLLAQRIAEVRLARQNGREWKGILGDEDDPGTVQLVSTILRRQSEASGYLRRELVVALRAEGQSIPSIAHLFGVTHQRVSNLLRRVAQGNAAAVAANGDSA
ncbi:MAG: helix-turn-helix domain-containing protein [Acidimicrobiales bacterium]